MLNELYLLLYPYSNLLFLIFNNQIFVTPKLILFEQLFYFSILSRQKKLLIPFKEKMRHIPLFRQFENIVNGICICNNQVLSNSVFQL